MDKLTICILLTMLMLPAALAAENWKLFSEKGARYYLNLSDLKKVEDKYHTWIKKVPLPNDENVTYIRGRKVSFAIEQITISCKLKLLKRNTGEAYDNSNLLLHRSYNQEGGMYDFSIINPQSGYKDLIDYICKQEQAALKPNQKTESYKKAEALTEKGSNIYSYDAYHTAKLLFEEAIETDPSYGPAYAELGWIYFSHDLDGVKGMQLMQKAKAMNAPNTYFFLGNAYLLQEKYDLAAKELDRALSYYPNRPKVIYSAILANCHTKNYGKASTLIDKLFQMQNAGSDGAFMYVKLIPPECSPAMR